MWPRVADSWRRSWSATLSEPMQYHQSVCRWWMCQALAVPGYISEWLHCPKWSKNGSVSRITSRKNPRSSVCVVSCFSSTPSNTAVSPC